MTRPCKVPTRLPDKPLTQAEVEKLWSLDRKELLSCGWSKKQIVDFFSKRDRKKY